MTGKRSAENGEEVLHLKLTLYQNAADYAKANNIALGTALTQTQIGALDKPMLWYVEQSVPDPSCNTVMSTVCPMVSTLVPQVYLPDDYAQALATPNGGVIAGKDVSLDIAGNLRNSGMVTASDTLTVKAASLDLAPNVVDVGTSAYRVQGGYMEYFGTQVQPGGFLSAANLDIQVGAIHAVNDALRVTNADGTVNQAATNALIGSSPWGASQEAPGIWTKCSWRCALQDLVCLRRYHPESVRGPLKGRQSHPHCGPQPLT